MLCDPRAYLWDIRDSIVFLGGRSLSEYSSDIMLRSAVERQLLIIGEALGQFTGRFPDLSQRITSHAEVIAFRNFLVHGYSFVADAIVWSIIHSDLPVLQREVAELLVELGG